MAFAKRDRLARAQLVSSLVLSLVFERRRMIVVDEPSFRPTLLDVVIILNLATTFFFNTYFESSWATPGNPS